jgi:hypothetical protein
MLPSEGILLLAAVDTGKRPKREEKICDEPILFSAFERWVEDGHAKADWSTFPWTLADEDSDPDFVVSDSNASDGQSDG